MAKQTLNNGETFGTIRSKINSNFTELYSLTGSSTENVAISSVTGLQTALDGKQASGSYATTNNPTLSGTITVNGNISAAEIVSAKSISVGLGNSIGSNKSVATDAIGAFGYENASNNVATFTLGFANSATGIGSIALGESAYNNGEGSFLWQGSSTFGTAPVAYNTKSGVFKIVAEGGSNFQGGLVINNELNDSSSTYALAISATNKQPVIALLNLPTSSSGLPSGALWRDTANGNVLKVVP